MRKFFNSILAILLFVVWFTGCKYITVNTTINTQTDVEKTSTIRDATAAAYTYYFIIANDDTANYNELIAMLSYSANKASDSVFKTYKDWEIFFDKFLNDAVQEANIGGNYPWSCNKTIIDTFKLFNDKWLIMMKSQRIAPDSKAIKTLYAKKVEEMITRIITHVTTSSSDYIPMPHRSPSESGAYSTANNNAAAPLGYYGPMNADTIPSTNKLVTDIRTNIPSIYNINGETYTAHDLMTEVFVWHKIKYGNVSNTIERDKVMYSEMRNLVKTNEQAFMVMSNFYNSLKRIDELHKERRRADVRSKQ